MHLQGLNLLVVPPTQQGCGLTVACKVGVAAHSTWRQRRRFVYITVHQSSCGQAPALLLWKVTGFQLLKTWRGECCC